MESVQVSKSTYALLNTQKQEGLDVIWELREINSGSQGLTISCWYLVDLTKVAQTINCGFGDGSTSWAYLENIGDDSEVLDQVGYLD